MRRTIQLAAALLLTTLGACGASPEPTRPNVLLISIDTLRADALGTYGQRFPTSPNIDALADRGVVCEDAVSTTSWTLPSHVSMLTGLNISAHGMCDERVLNASRAQGMAPPLRGEFLSESFERAGYRTAGLFTWKYLESRFGFGAGFSHWARIGSTVWSNPELAARLKTMRATEGDDAVRRWAAESPEDFDPQSPTSHLVVDEALAWLDQGPAEQPFFLFLHLFDVHDEYVAPEPYTNPFDPAYEGPVDGRKVSTADSEVSGDMPGRDLLNLRARYLGEVAWTDSQVGRLLDELERRGLAEDTLVVLTSDHGEEFYEHGHKIHRTQLYRESIQVPLIFSWPGQLPEGARVDGVTGIVDIAPTVAALVDLPGPAAVSGRDLSAELRGERPNEPTPYLSELLLFRSGVPVPELHLSIRHGDEHLIRVRDPQGELSIHRYDLAADPLEHGEGERFGPGTETMARFEGLLDQLRTEASEARSRSPRRGGALEAVDAGTAEELAAMGYLGDASTSSGLESTERLCMDGCLDPSRPTTPREPR